MDHITKYMTAPFVVDTKSQDFSQIQLIYLSVGEIACKKVKTPSVEQIYILSNIANTLGGVN